MINAKRPFEKRPKPVPNPPPSKEVLQKEWDLENGVVSKKEEAKKDDGKKPPVI